MIPETRILQILPRFPPAICGVSDQGFALGQQLTSAHGCHVTYLTVNDPKASKADLRLKVLRQKTASALLESLRAEQLPQGGIVVVQFSGYSYGWRGICFWLTTGLKVFLRERPDVRLISMFHELWSPAALCSRSGWVIPLQKMVIRQLLRISHAVRTSRVEYRNQIEALLPCLAGQVRVRNIFSNFGEPRHVTPINERKRQILIFQPPDLTSLRGQIFWNGWHQIRRLLPEYDTVVAGRSRSLPEDPSIHVQGFVTAEEASRLLNESRIAYFDYFNGYLGKSSIFAAIACHGVVPVMPEPNQSDVEGILCGQHYLLCDDEVLGDTRRLETISRTVKLWYEPHGLAATAADYIESITELNEEGQQEISRKGSSSGLATECEYRQS